MTTNENGRSPRYKGPADETATTTLENHDTVDPQLTLALLAAVMAAPNVHVHLVLDVLDPELVRPVDAPTADALNAAHDLARQGIDPTPVLLLDELRRTGHLDEGHHGRLLANRLEDAVTMPQPPERLLPLAAAVAAHLVRARGVVAADTIRHAYASGPEIDCEPTLLREGGEVRKLHRILDQLRAPEVTR